MASEFRPAWKALAAATIGVACGASPIPFNVLPVVIGPMHTDLGWDFTDISFGIMLYGIVGAMLAPVIGMLVDRHGVKPVATISLGLFGIVFSAMYFLPRSLPIYFAMCALFGMVGIGSTPVSWSRAISMWFNEHRGLALGILLLGTSLTALVVPQLGTWLLGVGGWRSVFGVVGLLPLVLALPLALVFFREPRPDEIPKKSVSTSGKLTGITMPEALKSYRFYLLYLSVAVTALAYGGAHINMIQIVMLKGFSKEFGADVVSVVAIGILTGRVIVGMLFDRFWAPATAFVVLAMPAISCIILTDGSTSAGAVMLAGFLLGFAAGAESDIVAFMAARYFGMREYGRIYGLLYMGFGIFASLSPLAYGWMRDRTGDYDLVLHAALVLFLVGGIVLLLLGRYPHFEGEDEDHPETPPVALQVEG